MSLSAEDRPPAPKPQTLKQEEDLGDDEYLDDDEEEEMEGPEHHGFLQGHTALKFLLAGGIAGAGMSVAQLVPTLLTIAQCHERVLRLSID